MEGPTQDAHMRADDDLWPITNFHLSVSKANALFAACIVTNVFFTVWMTRKIRVYADLTGCFNPIGMSILTLLYFAVGNALFVRVGADTTTENCNSISKFMYIFYLIVKAYTGIYLFKKARRLWFLHLREMADILEPGWSPTAKRSCAKKKSYYFVFGPMALIFTACATAMIVCIRASIQKSEDSVFCIIQILFPEVILPIFLLSTVAIASVFAFSFAAPSGLFSRRIACHPASTRACAASIVTATTPFINIAYFFTMSGHESSSLINLCCGIDVAVALFAVWYVEGSWTQDREKVCKCDQPLPESNAGTKLVADYVATSTVEGVGAVRRLHTQTEDILESGVKVEEIGNAL